MKVGILLNSDMAVASWQYNCILKLKNAKIIFFVSNEENSNYQIRNYYIKNFIYFIINLISIRQKKRKINFSSFKDYSVKNITYKTDSKNWQHFNSESINIILQEKPDFIYKCGMKLLKISDQLKFIPILSHHHGDPSKFRGRPAGFYEILKGEKRLGQIVQILSNRLDAGQIISYGETSIYPWSYRKTLNDAYNASPLIFAKALKNLKSGIITNKEKDGTNYKLPSNYLGIYFIFREISNLVARIIYGIFYERYWNVRYCNKFLIKNIDTPMEIFDYIHSKSSNFSSLSVLKKYKFYADPFILDSKIILEGLNKKSRKGDLLLIDINTNSIVESFNFKGKHLSYPYTYKSLNKTFIYPDSGDLNNVHIFQTNKNIFKQRSKILSFRKGLTDPSVLEHEGLFFLFANYPDEKCILRLWVSSDPMFSDPEEHPESPICISPLGGRSGGRIFVFNKKIYRFGQDFSGAYGNGLILFEINSLTKNNYSETAISSFKFKDSFKGPHNIDFSSDIITWDYYHEKFNLLAGINRIISKF